MKTAAIVYPHQLFDPHPAIAGATLVVLVEDPLFFTQYRFHRQKLMLHRASMKRFERELKDQGHRTAYLDANEVPTTQAIAEHLSRRGIQRARVVRPSDDWLERRLSAGLKKARIELQWIDDPDFLTPLAEIDRYVEGKAKLFFTDFYINQRKRLSILLEAGKPVGGKWSFDAENRKKLPKNLVTPKAPVPAEDEFTREAQRYVRERFPEALGVDRTCLYPTSRQQAHAWLVDFVQTRLHDFGDYEDAIRAGESTLFHSVLTPMLNIGLISPGQIVREVLKQADECPLNSIEGFIRQVIGWREFIRLVYLKHGRHQRTQNFWNHDRPLPNAFYDGTTGIVPVDRVIQRVLDGGYCHHIERLMILGNFMLLCDIRPDDVYRWFMEFFVDSYDWVMVPNIYGMSQHADGGLMTTKPYISGSSYVLKMSDFPRGPWCEIWDALYWRFVDRHESFFAGNPRMAVMAKMKQKLGPKMDQHRRTANAFLERLHAR